MNEKVENYFNDPEPGEWLNWQGDKEVPVDPKLVRELARVQAYSGTEGYNIDVDQA